MTTDCATGILTVWAMRNLPARLDVATTARVLGFAEHDIQILMAARKLVPLGDPAQNAPKWFCAMEVLQLTSDREWLHKATKEVSKYWRYKRERSERSRQGRTSSSPRQGEKSSPKPSPDSSPNAENPGGDGAMTRTE
jgi:hypothetical protein